MNGIAGAGFSLAPWPNRARLSLPRSFWIAKAIGGITALMLQLAGAYAAVATFGVVITAALYAVGGLAVLLPYIVWWRATTCLRGA